MDVKNIPRIEVIVKNGKMSWLEGDLVGGGPVEGVRLVVNQELK